MTAAPEATIVVELTPQGRGAIAVVLVSGPNAFDAVGRHFIARSGRSLTNLKRGQIAFGHWGGNSGEEVVVCSRGEQEIEIHCHGGTAAVRAIIDRLINVGCQSVPWRDWLRQTATDPIQAAARIALADAATERATAILLDQFNGALSAAIHSIVESVKHSNWSAAAETIDELLSRGELGLHLTTPWNIVICGPPNVGKSSLINAIAGYERAIVSPIPGTTRDVVTVTTAIDGWPVQLADTAGIRDSQDELESAGIELATTALANADLILSIHDASQSGVVCAASKSNEFVAARNRRVVEVANKIDLFEPASRDRLFVQTADRFGVPRKVYPVSARTGEGLPVLLAAVGRLLVPSPPPDHTPVPFTLDQLVALAAARRVIERKDIDAATHHLQALLTTAEQG